LQMPGEVVGQHAQEHVCADPVLEVVVDRADLKLGAFEGPERELDLLEVLVGADHVTGAQFGLAEVGPEDVDPVECRLGLDLGGFALEGEALIGDRDLEVLLHLVVPKRRPDGQPDLV